MHTSNLYKEFYRKKKIEPNSPDINLHTIYQFYVNSYIESGKSSLPLLLLNDDENEATTSLTECKIAHVNKIIHLHKNILHSPSISFKKMKLITKLLKKTLQII